jgi:hypothetical protein
MYNDAHSLCYGVHVKFYFCEKCGTRLTDQDIAAGAARDKKLRGVYCTDCANGVLTIETLAITDLEARRIVPQGEKTAEKTRPSDSPRTPVTHAHSKRKQQSLPGASLYVGAAIACGMVLLAVLAATRSSPAISPKKELASNHTLPRTNGPDSSAPALELPRTVNKESPVREPNRPAVDPALESSAASPTPSTTPPLVSSPIKDTPAPEPDVPAPVSPTPAAPKPADVAVPDTVPAPVLNAVQSESAEDELFEQYFALLQKGELEKALQLCNANTSVTPPIRNSLGSAISILIAERDGREQAAREHVGKTLDLVTKTDRVRGELADVNSQGLRVKKSIVADGVSVGFVTVLIKWEDLDAAANADIIRKKRAPEQAPFIALLESMIAGQMESSDAALANCTSHPSARIVTRFFEKFRREKREAQAASAWSSIQSRAAKATTQDAARALDKDLRTFNTTYADTRFIAASTESIATLRAEVDRLALGLDPRLLKAFRGKILSFEPKSQVLSVQYDFADANQLDDFQDPSKSASGRKAANGVTVSHYSKYDCHLWLPQFSSDDLLMKFTVQDLKKQSVVVRLSGENEARVLFRLTSSTVTIEKGLVVLEQIDLKQPVSFDSGNFEVRCKNNNITIKADGKLLLDQAMPCSNIKDGIGIAGGASTEFTIKQINVTGKLSSKWLAATLAK